MEGKPPAPKPKAEEAPASEVRTPEYWVARPELPFSREYIELEVKVAREVSERLRVPMSQIVDDYAPIFHAYIWPDTKDYLDIDTMSDDELADAISEKEKTHSAAEPLTEYHKGDRYGCFSFFSHTGGTGEELKGRVDIHFSNAEFDDTGPLSKDKIDRRLAELKDMFTEIKREFPEAKYVRGDSWLYNVDAYKRLFPESYTASPEVDTSRGALATGRTWGQFADSHLELKKELGEEFLRKVKALEEITPDTVRGALPYQALIVTAPIEDFYKKYGVE